MLPNKRSPSNDRYPVDLMIFPRLPVNNAQGNGPVRSGGDRGKTGCTAGLARIGPWRAGRRSMPLRYPRRERPSGNCASQAAGAPTRRHARREHPKRSAEVTLLRRRDRHSRHVSSSFQALRVSRVTLAFDKVRPVARHKQFKTAPKTDRTLNPKAVHATKHQRSGSTTRRNRRDAIQQRPDLDWINRAPGGSPSAFQGSRWLRSNRRIGRAVPPARAMATAEQAENPTTPCSAPRAGRN